MSNDVSPERYQAFKQIYDDIVNKIETIRQATKFDSGQSGMTEHPMFSELVAMGPRIVPTIMHHLIHNGASWVHLTLLIRITGHRPYGDRAAGRFYLQVGRWLIWYEESDHHANADVYMGLLD